MSTPASKPHEMQQIMQINPAKRISAITELRNAFQQLVQVLESCELDIRFTKILTQLKQDIARESTTLGNFKSHFCDAVLFLSQKYPDKVKAVTTEEAGCFFSFNRITMTPNSKKVIDLILQKVEEIRAVMPTPDQAEEKAPVQPSSILPPPVVVLPQQQRSKTPEKVEIPLEVLSRNIEEFKGKAIILEPIPKDLETFVSEYTRNISRLFSEIPLSKENILKIYQEIAKIYYVYGQINAKPPFSLEFKQIEDLCCDILQINLKEEIEQKKTITINFDSWENILVFQRVFVLNFGPFSTLLPEHKEEVEQLIVNFTMKYVSTFPENTEKLVKSILQTVSDSSAPNTASYFEKTALFSRIVYDCFLKSEELKPQKATAETKEIQSRIKLLCIWLFYTMSGFKVIDNAKLMLNGSKIIFMPGLQTEEKARFIAFLQSFRDSSIKNLKFQEVIITDDAVYLGNSSITFTERLSGESSTEIESTLTIIMQDDLGTDFFPVFGVTHLDPSNLSKDLFSETSPPQRTILFQTIQKIWHILDEPIKKSFFEKVVKKLIFLTNSQTAQFFHSQEDRKFLAWSFDFLFEEDFFSALKTELEKYPNIFLQKDEAKNRVLLLKRKTVDLGKIAHGPNTCFLATFLNLVYRSPYFQGLLDLSPEALSPGKLAREKILAEFCQKVFKREKGIYQYFGQGELRNITEIMSSGILEENETDLPVTREGKQQIRNVPLGFQVNLIRHALEKSLEMAGQEQKEQLTRELQEFNDLCEQAEKTKTVLQFDIEHFIGENSAILPVLKESIRQSRDPIEFFNVKLTELKPTVEPLLLLLIDRQTALNLDKASDHKEELAKITKLISNLTKVNSLDPVLLRLEDNFKIINEILSLMQDAQISTLFDRTNEAYQHFKAVADQILIWKNKYYQLICDNVFRLYRDQCLHLTLPDIKAYFKALLNKLATGNTITVIEMFRLVNLLQQGKIFLESYEAQDLADLLPVFGNMDQTGLAYSKITEISKQAQILMRREEKGRFNLEAPVTLYLIQYEDNVVSVYQAMDQAFITASELEKFTQETTNEGRKQIVTYHNTAVEKLIKRDFLKLSSTQKPNEIMFRVILQKKIIALKPYLDLGKYFDREEFSPYELAKILVHTGEHWYSYLKIDGKWYKSDDIGGDIVEIPNFPQIQSEILSNADNLYLLYNRIDSTTLSAELRNELEIQSLRQQVYLGKIPASSSSETITKKFDLERCKARFVPLLQELAQRLFQLNYFVNSREDELVLRIRADELKTQLFNIFVELEKELDLYYQALPSSFSQSDLTYLQGLEKDVNELYIKLIESVTNFGKINLTLVSNILKEFSPSDISLASISELGESISVHIKSGKIQALEIDLKWKEAKKQLYERYNKIIEELYQTGSDYLSIKAKLEALAKILEQILRG